MSLFGGDSLMIAYNSMSFISGPYLLGPIGGPKQLLTSLILAQQGEGFILFKFWSVMPWVR